MKVVSVKDRLDDIEGFSVYLSLPPIAPWASKVIKETEDLEGVLVTIPLDTSSLDQEGIEWVLEAIQLCVLRCFVVSDGSPIQLLNLGLSTLMDSSDMTSKTVVYASPSFSNQEYLNIFCWKFGIIRVSSIFKLLDEIKKERNSWL